MTTKYSMLDEMESFYVTLPSNIINNRNNTISDFTVILPGALQLDASWRVGLSEIHYTNSWFNLRRKNTVDIVDSNEQKMADTSYLPPGRYSDIQSILDGISKHVMKSYGISTLPKTSFDEPSQTFRMTKGKLLDNGTIHYSFSDELASMLGVIDGYETRHENELLTVQSENYYKVDGAVDTVQAWLPVEWMEGKQCYDLTGGIHSIYVYSDVVDYSIVGNVKAPLLRVVHIPPDSRFGEPVHIMYDRPYYLPLSTKDIHEIQIVLRDDAGDLIEFNFGRVEVTLHFIKDG